MWWLTWVIRWRHFTAVSLVVLSLLLTCTAANILVLTGHLPDLLRQPETRVSISGPGAGGAVRIQAYILGAVRTPGVYSLPQGARVHDLVAAAGGALQAADLTRVDLAAPVNDGQSVYVPVVGEVVPLVRGGRINLNSASEYDLHNALGISLTTARKIVAYRAAHGNFTAVSQLLLVPISRSIFDRIKDLVTV
jgi:competence protein ComEA